MNVKFLKAGSGDCILIQHKGQNILVDGGNDPLYLRNEIATISSNNQHIDVLIITHHDDDHISGIIDLLKSDIAKDCEGFIKRVIFNSPRKIQEKINIDKNNNLSYKQAFKVEELLHNLKYNWDSVNEDSDSIEIDGTKLRFLSPSTHDLQEYSENKGAYLAGDFKCDWNATMSALEKHIDDASLDKSQSNRTSIVMLLESSGQRILLTGDCTPDRLKIVLDKLIKEQGTGTSLELDYVKLPHHGSYRSLSKEILEKINCSKFIISTNSKKHFLPNKRAILKICNFMKRETDEIEFLFNYEEALNALQITDLERKKHRVKLTPNNRNYGISI